MKQKRDVIRPCSHTDCLRGSLCPNFTPRYTRNSFGFPSCMSNPIYLEEQAKKALNENKQSIA